MRDESDETREELLREIGRALDGVEAITATFGSCMVALGVINAALGSCLAALGADDGRCPDTFPADWS